MSINIVLQTIREYHLVWAVIGLFISRAISFLSNYINGGEYRTANPQMLMVQPYGRIIVLHITIIFGGMLMMALHSPAAGLVLLMVLKTALDLVGHLRERRKFAPVIATTAQPRQFTSAPLP